MGACICKWHIYQPNLHDLLQTRYNKSTGKSLWRKHVKLYTVSLNQDSKFRIVIGLKTVWVKGINIQFHKDNAMSWKEKKKVYQKLSKV